MPIFRNIWDQGASPASQCQRCGLVVRCWTSLQAHTDEACAKEMERQRASIQQNLDRLLGKTHATPTNANPPDAYAKLEDEHFSKSCEPDGKEPHDPDFCI